MDAFTVTVYALIFIIVAYTWGHKDGRKAALRDAPTSSAPKSAAEAAAAAIASANAHIQASLNPPWPADTAPPVAIGERFLYLGVPMICTRHSVMLPWGIVAWLNCEYVGDGVVRQATFTGVELDAVRAEIARVPVLSDEVAAS